MDARELQGQELFCFLVYQALKRALAQRRHAQADELACCLIRLGASDHADQPR